MTLGKAPIFLGILLVTVGLAGCVVDEADGGDQPPGASDCMPGTTDDGGTRLLNTTDDPIVDDRALMWDHESYNVRTCSLPSIANHALNPNGTPHKYIGEIDMRGDLDLGAVAVLGNGETPRVYLIDISDRDAPEVVSTIDQAGTYIVDVKISDDGKVLYTASQSTGTEGVTGSPTTPTTPTGFTVYNIEDPENPVHIGFVADSQIGCHMLDPVQVADNQDAVFCISQHVRSYLIQRDGDQIVNFGFVEYVPQSDGVPTPAGPPVVGDPAGTFAQGPHDMTAYHEGDGFGEGASYMVVSHWGEGVKVLDITDAPVVTEVGSWDGEGATHYHGNVHTAMMFDVGDKRYIVASPEYTSPSAEQVPSLWVLDATDLSNLQLVGEWFHPNEHVAQGLYLTTHQWQVAPTGPDVNASDVRIYLTYNHAGVWVLDFSKMLEGDLWDAILGFNLAREPLDQDTAVANAILSTWDVNVVDGYIYGSDRATGLWVFHYEGDTLGDERLRGFS